MAEGLLLDGVGTIHEDSFATLVCEHIERCFQRSIVPKCHSVHRLLATKYINKSDNCPIGKMYAHFIQKCEKNHVGMVEVVLFHITIAFVRGG